MASGPSRLKPLRMTNEKADPSRLKAFGMTIDKQPLGMTRSFWRDGGMLKQFCKPRCFDSAAAAAASLSMTTPTIFSVAPCLRG